MDIATTIVIALLVCIVAALYSSVGHGGASGYLAVLSLFAYTTREMSSTALVLNVLVSTIGFVAFLRAKHFRFALAWPFLLLSIPGAFLGGLVHVSEEAYYMLLAAVLLVAAYRLSRNGSFVQNVTVTKKVSLEIALPVGAGIGFLSGVVGVGGGIFLSPLMILLGWAEPKQTAAVAAFFILVNSIAGIGGRLVQHTFDVRSMVPFLVAAFLGGLLGSYFGANKFTGMILRRVLAVVLLLAAGKLVLLVIR